MPRRGCASPCIVFMLAVCAWLSSTGFVGRGIFAARRTVYRQAAAVAPSGTFVEDGSALICSPRNLRLFRHGVCWQQRAGLCGTATWRRGQRSNPSICVGASLSAQAPGVDEEDPPATRVPLPYDGMTALSDADRECIAKRHYYRVNGVNWDMEKKIIGAGRRCRHGWPQALLYDPIWMQGRLHDSTRLTCPLLVAAIDAYEKLGYIPRYNKRVQEDEAWKQQLYETNCAQRDLRKLLLEGRDDELAQVRAVFDDDLFERIMNSGLSNLPLNSTDVKCLHAQVGDELVRGGNSIIAQHVLQDLEAYGIDTMGSDSCCDHCNCSVLIGEGRWNWKEARLQWRHEMRAALKKQAREAESIQQDHDAVDRND